MSRTNNKANSKSNDNELEVIFHGGDILKWLIAVPKLEAVFASKGCLKYIEGREIGTTDEEIFNMAPNYERIAINMRNKEIDRDGKQTSVMVKYQELIEENEWLAYLLRDLDLPLQQVLNPTLVTVIPLEANYNYITSLISQDVNWIAHPYRLMTRNAANPPLSKFELKYTIPEFMVHSKIAISKLNSEKITQLNIQVGRNAAAAIYLTAAEIDLHYLEFLPPRIESINSIMSHLVTDITTEFDKQKTVYIKNLEMVKTLKSNCNQVFNSCLGTAPLDVIHTNIKNENYVQAWQQLKDYHTQSGSYNSTEITIAAQNAVFNDNERVEQWVEKMKIIFKNIASVSYLQDMMERYPNDKNRWRIDDLCTEANSWDNTDSQIRDLGKEVYLMHSVRLNYLTTSLSKNPSSKFKVILDKFLLDDIKTVKTIYNLLIKWNAEQESHEVNNKLISTVTTKMKNNTKIENKNIKSNTKHCINHPNTTSHSTSECKTKSFSGQNKQKFSDKGKIEENKNKRFKSSNNNNKSMENKPRHCKNCQQHFPHLAKSHDTEYCRQPGGVKHNNSTTDTKITTSAFLSPDISNAINTSVNSIANHNQSEIKELKEMLLKLSRGQDL